MLLDPLSMLLAAELDIANAITFLRVLFQVKVHLKDIKSLSCTENIPLSEDIIYRAIERGKLYFLYH